MTRVQVSSPVAGLSSRPVYPRDSRQTIVFSTGDIPTQGYPHYPQRECSLSHRAHWEGKRVTVTICPRISVSAYPQLNDLPPGKSIDVKEVGKPLLDSRQYPLYQLRTCTLLDSDSLSEQYLFTGTVLAGKDNDSTRVYSQGMETKPSVPTPICMETVCTGGTVRPSQPSHPGKLTSTYGEILVMGGYLVIADIGNKRVEIRDKDTLEVEHTAPLKHYRLSPGGKKTGVGTFSPHPRSSRVFWLGIDALTDNVLIYSLRLKTMRVSTRLPSSLQAGIKPEVLAIGGDYLYLGDVKGMISCLDMDMDRVLSRYLFNPLMAEMCPANTPTIPANKHIFFELQLVLAIPQMVIVGYVLSPSISSLHISVHSPLTLQPLALKTIQRDTAMCFGKIIHIPCEKKNTRSQLTFACILGESLALLQLLPASRGTIRLVTIVSTQCPLLFNVFMPRHYPPTLTILGQKRVETALPCTVALSIQII